MHRRRSSEHRSVGDDVMPDTSEETLDNCLKLCSELRRMGFSGNSSTTSIIPEDALATAAYNQQPLSPEGLVQARYAGIYLVEYKFLEALGNREYRLTGKDVEMCEKQILEIVNRNPGCTLGYFSDQQHEKLHGLIGKDAIIRRYRGMMPHYYTPEQIQERGLAQ